MGSEGAEEKDQQDAYDSFQSLLQTIITVSTLLMGFIITGALISLTFTGGESFSAEEVMQFVRVAFKAFMLALLSFSLSLILTILGTQIHATPTCGANYASRFLMLFAWVILLSELCLYGCADCSLDFVGKYIYLNYESPSLGLCPGSAANNTLKANKFCALVGADLYDAAVDPTICGPPQTRRNQSQRPYNPTDPNSRICLQLDAYYYDNVLANNLPAEALRKDWFGWDLAISLKRPDTETEGDMVNENAKILGEAMCGKTEALAQGAKDKCKKNPGSVECATVLLAYNNADECAGAKYDDVTKCHRACGWTTPWGWQGVFIHTHDGEKREPISMAFIPIRTKITQLQECINAWIWIRIGIWLFINLYTGFCRCCIAETEAEDEDDDYDELEMKTA